MEEIKPITMPGIHQKFLAYFKKQQEPEKLKVLDMGAGHGAFSKRLHDMGFDVHACDLFPENFVFDKIECKKVDITGDFPYEDNTFDIIIAIEVSEHVLDHEKFFSETNRILKPGGRFYVSTPNILSLKSRVRFLFSGFPYSFKPLEIKNYDGLQHVASLTLDQYDYLAVKNNFQQAEFEIDKEQSTSKLLMIFIYPFLYILHKIKNIGNKHNQRKLLLGRLLFMKFRK